MKYYKHPISILFASLILTTACSENDFPGSSGLEPDENGLSTVSLEVSLSGTNTWTRVNSDPTQSYISTGDKIDILIYSIYKLEKDASGKDSYTLQTYFQNSEEAINGIKPGVGQTITTYSADETKHVVLKLDPNYSYRIAFWAQYSGCGAYDAKDLTNIKVSYENALNNDEGRDVFAGFIDLKSTDKNLKVVLRRPLAQINIATSGADYKNLIYDPYLNPSGITISQSKINLTGVADSYNALTGVASAGNASLTANFGWSDLPAWILTGSPSYDEKYLGEDYKEKNPFVLLKEGLNSQNDEEFLFVKLNNDNKPLAQYLTEYPTVLFKKDDEGKETSEVESYLTETFKYLSMCYVLVPTKLDNTGAPTGTTLKLSYDLRQKKNSADNSPINLTEKFLVNVPVRANYRTNILGGLYGENGGPDPTSIFNLYQIPVVLVSDFEGDHNVFYYDTTYFPEDPNNLKD